MTAARARAPRVTDLRRKPTPYSVRIEPYVWWDDQVDAKFEAVCAQAIADYRRTLGAVDGTRSEQLTRWTGEFVAAAAEDESEVSAA